MTYANLVFHSGALEFCLALRAAGVTGLIVPDVPLDEVTGLAAAAEEAGVDLVLLASPSTSAARRSEIARRSRGFVYAVSLMGTTGERAEMPVSGRELATSLRAATDLPVLLGFGVSGADHVTAARRWADGVVVASALLRRVLEGAGPAAVGAWLATLRSALDTSDE
jgi:tryptophan synthase alpha chain